MTFSLRCNGKSRAGNAASCDKQPSGFELYGSRIWNSSEEEIKKNPDQRRECTERREMAERLCLEILCYQNSKNVAMELELRVKGREDSKNEQRFVQ